MIDLLFELLSIAGDLMFVPRREPKGQQTYGARRRAARELGLKLKYSGDRKNPSLAGKIGDHYVSVVSERGFDENFTALATRIVVGSGDLVPSDITLRAEGVGSKIGKALGGQDIRIGDTV